MKPPRNSRGSSTAGAESDSGFGKRKSAPERRDRDRRKNERRKKARRGADGQLLDVSSEASCYRQCALALRGLVDLDRHVERRRTLLKMARDYERLADIVDERERNDAAD
jgi:hypothetical protein